MRERPEWTTQDNADVALDWGPNGLRAVGGGADAVVIVDVLRFTTAVDVAVGRGAAVIAFRWDRGADAAATATERGALLGVRGDDAGPGLSPGSLLALGPGQRIVLPSPNGSALVVGAADRGASLVVAACLRNAAAVTSHLIHHPGGGRVALIAAGERWNGATGPLRVAIEDLLGAGAVASGLRTAGRSLSAEAALAADAFDACRHRLPEVLAGTVSGRELLARDRSDDVDLAAALDVSAAVPILAGDELVDGSRSGAPTG